MRKFFFFIFLFTLLLRGVDEVYAGKLLHTTCFLADQEFRKSLKKDEQNFVQTIYDNNAHCDIICEEPEDDSHQDFAKKYKLLTGYYFFHTPTFYYYHLCGCLKDRLPDEKSLACKYITQRALRI